MTVVTVLLILAVILGFYVAWNIGANDVANAMGTSVGSGALTLFGAVVLAAILEFAGAFLLGAHVAETVESGVVDPSSFANDSMIFVLGMMASLLAAGVWLQFASYFGWPVSTTHTLVGALVGFGLVAGGVQAIYWTTVWQIVLSWIISPLMGGTLAYLIFNVIRRQIFYSSNPVAATKRLSPLFVFFLFFILAMALLFQGLENLSVKIGFWMSFTISVGVGLIAALLTALLARRVPVPKIKTEETQGLQVTSDLERALRHLRRAKSAAEGEVSIKLGLLEKDTDELFHSMKRREAGFTRLAPMHSRVERTFAYLQILSACFMAFSHGANDVANAIGPLSAIWETLHAGTIQHVRGVSLWVLALGGAGIVVGLATWGWRVIRTVGERITELTPTRGFAAEFGAATTIVIASRMGLPISTTHTLVGAVLGVGLARGIGAINLRTVRNIVISWVVTVPAGAILAVIFYEILKSVFI